MPVSSVLRESLAASGAENGGRGGGGGLLQSQIASGTKHLVLKAVEYEEYPRQFLSHNEDVKRKYILLSASNGDKVASKKMLAAPGCTNGSSNGLDSVKASSTNGVGPLTPKKQTATSNNELPQPKRVLFPREQVQVGWNSSGIKWQVGAGFINQGNTCYLNSTLQALLHIPAMANWLVSDEEHRKTCSVNNDYCIICAVSKTLVTSQNQSHPIRPYLVYNKLKLICKHLVQGRQEDAHEFLRYLIEAMEKAYLQRFKGGPSMDQYSKETTPLNQILGGYLRSSVRCLSCNHVSITFQHFEDLLLDIRKANTIDEALTGYFSREKLEDMGYSCEGCKKKVNATKQFSLERPPIVLCIQLKRFTMQGSKLSKWVDIKSKLDLSQYVKKAWGNDQPLIYRLVSMVTHLGSSQHCGHYTAVGLSDSGAYYQFDDSCVAPISLSNVLSTSAYIIFYELESVGLSRKALTNGNHVAASTMTLKPNLKPPYVQNGGDSTKIMNGRNGSVHSNNFIGPVLPPNHPAAKARSMNGDGQPAVKEEPAQRSGILKLKTCEAGPTVALKKYPSAEAIFRSPTKPSGSLNGKAASPDEKKQSPTKSLVPYHSNLSSDDDEDEDEIKKESAADENQNGHATPSPTQSPLKNGMGYHMPLLELETNSGTWEVSEEEEPEKEQVESKSPGPKENGTATSLHSGNGRIVAQELLKQDHKGYGGVSVSTWSGQKSNLDKEVSSEKSLKRLCERKEEDDEMDRGNVKKLKPNQKAGRDNPGFNAFQEHENKRQSMGSSNGYHPHTHHRHSNNKPWVHKYQSADKNKSPKRRFGYDYNNQRGPQQHQHHNHHQRNNYKNYNGNRNWNDKQQRRHPKGGRWH